MLGSQSTKLKKATLEISGDPRFRLTSTVPHNPLVLFGVVGGAIAAAVIVMFLADGALAKQENVVATYDCLGQVRASLDAVKHLVEEERAASAAQCFAPLAPLGVEEADALFARVKDGFENARRVHQAGPVEAEVEAVRDLQDRIEGFYRWYVQNKTSYGIN